MDIETIKSYFQNVLYNFRESNSGWCGNEVLAGNILLIGEDDLDDDLKIPISPYQITESRSKMNLYNTIHYKDKNENKNNYFNIQSYRGNNGTVTCSAYCANKNGKWSPPKDSECVGATISGQTSDDKCNTLVGSNKGLESCHCLIAPVRFNVLRWRTISEDRYKISRDDVGDGWDTKVASFLAYTQDPGKGAVQYYICDAQNPQRFLINTTGPGNGWEKRDSFWAFPNNPGDGVKYNILYAKDPWRYKIIKEGDEGSQGGGWIPGAGFGTSKWCFFPSDNWNYDTAIRKASEKCQQDNCGGFSVYKYDKQDRFFCFRGKDTYKTDEPGTNVTDTAKCYLPTNGYGKTFVDQGLSKSGCQSMDDNPTYSGGVWEIAHTFWTITKKPTVNLEDLPRMTSCSIENINKTPCFGGLNSDGKWSANSGCDAANSNFKYPSQGYLKNATPTSLPQIKDPITGKTINLGKWTKGRGLLPKSQKNDNLTDISTNKSKYLNFSTYVISPPKMFRGVQGTSPSLAKVCINIYRSKLSQTDLLTTELDRICEYIAKSIPLPDTGNKSTIDSIYKTKTSILAQIDKYENKLSGYKREMSASRALIIIPLAGMALYDAAMDGIKTGINETRNVVYAIESKIKNLETQLMVLVSPIINEMVKLNLNDLTKTCKGKFTGEASQLGLNTIYCQLQYYKSYIDIIFKFYNYLLNRDYPNLKKALLDIIDKAKTKDIELFDLDTLMYKPVSVAFQYVNNCSIIDNNNDKNNPTFPFVNNKAGGICEMNGCNSSDSNQYCSCKGDTPYSCPFETYDNNLTKCQSSILKVDPLPKITPEMIKKIPPKIRKQLPAGFPDNLPKIRVITSMRENILYWFNTLVGTNGCFQRSLAMVYGKCLVLNTKNLKTTNWDPTKNKISVNKKTNQDLYETRKL